MLKCLLSVLLICGLVQMNGMGKVNYDFRYLEPTVEQRVEMEKCGKEVPHLPALNAMVGHNQVDLLSHPLCVEYINSKWSSYGGPIHWGYFMLYLSFVVFFTFFVSSVDPTPIPINGTVSHKNVTVDGEQVYSQYSVGQHFALIYIMVYAALNVVKELFQAFSQGYKYFISYENYAEWTLYCCTLSYVIPFFTGDVSHYQWATGSVAIFFAWFNILVYQQRIDQIGIYIVMFYNIFSTIVRVMIVFSVIIIAFGFAFYMIMSGETNHAFKRPEIAIFRVFSMMMGELDFINSFVLPLTDGDPETLHYEFLSYGLLVICVIFLPILLMNLLIGLAVGDIADVQRNAELKRLAMQVDLHSDYEPKLPIKILEWVTKDNITIYPNSVCPRSSSIGRMFDKFKEKYVVRDGGNKRFSSVLELKNSKEKCTEIIKIKQRVRGLSAKMDKQYDLLRLIVQKMEIHSEADEQDEGDAPQNADSGLRLRNLHSMPQLVSAAVSSFNAGRLRNRTTDSTQQLSITPRTVTPSSDTDSVAEPSI